MAEKENAEKEAAPAAPAPVPAAGAGNNKLMTILTVANIVVTLGMVSVLVISFKKERTEPKVGDIVAQEHGSGHGEEAGGGHGGGEKGKGGHGEGHGGEHGEKGAKQSQFGKMVTLELFTVNLSTVGSSSPKFARVNISLEVPTDDAESEVTQKMPQVRNTIIDLFNSKRPSDLATTEGRNYIKEEIKNALNTFLVTGKIKGVFFTSFALSS